MAVGSDVNAVCYPSHGDGRVYPVGYQTDWVQLGDVMNVTDNSTASVTNPGAITRTTLHDLEVQNRGTTLLLCMKYDDGHATITTSPVIQAFGRDTNGVYHKLKNAAGTHEITLTAVGLTAATDVHDGTYLYTDTIEVDLDGAKFVRVAIKTAFNGSGDDSLSYLLGKTL